jgi:(1->4)-alpha-D-glucan 1-alpha-D-glucosylmutase
LDFWGQERRVPESTQRALLTAMGIPVQDPEALQSALQEREARPWRRPLATVLVVPEHGPGLQVSLHLPKRHAGKPWRWTLTEENGSRFVGEVRPQDLPLQAERELDGEWIGRYALSLPHLPPAGYHRLELEPDREPDWEPDREQAGGASLRLIVTPARCYLPEALEGSNRVWGTAVQVYSLRSGRNWGAGDLTDLRQLVDCCGSLGADLVGINPVHALCPSRPAQDSPYNPSSRQFLNVLYIDVESVPEFAECEAAAQAVHLPEFSQNLEALRAADLVDWPGVAAAKFRILEILYRCFREHHLVRQSERAHAFRAFQGERGRSLHLHALFEALQDHFFRNDHRTWGWPVWPQEYRHPDAPAVAEFAAQQADRIEFYQYLQWVAEGQLGAVGQRCKELGLGVGLYQDLALGVDRGGAEAWALQDLYALDAGIGAPPDDFNLRGQNWGLPPMLPERLTEVGYEPFIETLRRNMRHAGALRIDHVMGLMRLFWIPAGAGPSEGCYVRYPFQDLLGILALESQRNACAVVGEDLGTVPEAVRSTLEPLAVLSTRLFYFERDADGRFQPPAAYPGAALVAVSNHDLPTLAGFWQGRDLAVRQELDQFPSPEVRANQITRRAMDRAGMLLALEHEGLLPSELSADPASAPQMTPELARAVHAYLARTPAKILSVQLEDVLGQTEQVNLPGSSTAQHPNWRRKLDLALEDLTADSRVQDLAQALREQRTPQRRNAPPPAGRPGSAVVSIPRATYRLQFHGGFTFAQAASLVPYLAQLGISHCYASPYLRARPGSQHGYDIIDHTSLNPEIGTPEDYQHLVRTLHEHGMGQILDLVPNHMGVGGSDNAWWLDVLENGQASVYAEFFDIDWRPSKEELRGKLLLPILGNHYGDVLESGELRLSFDAEAGELSVVYYEHRCPIDPVTYPLLLGHRLDRLVLALGPDNPLLLEVQSLVTAFNHLPSCHEVHPEPMQERNRDKEIRKRQLARLCSASPEVRQFLEANVKELNGTPGDPASFDLLHGLLEAQPYRLAYWRVASDKINYRRFFDINELAGLRMEVDRVFQATHGLVLDLVHRGALDGLRIDHPDGLHDPAGYYAQLVQQSARIPAPVLVTTNGGGLEPDADWSGRQVPYVVVEKILAVHEHLPEDWQVHGTTGYDFTNQVNGLLVYAPAESQLTGTYSQFLGHQIDFDDLLYECKKLIMKVALASELNVLANQLNRISEADRHTRDYTLSGLREALAEVVACFPVYRTYVGEQPVRSEDRRYVDWAVAQAKKRNPDLDEGIFDFIRAALLVELGEQRDGDYRDDIRAFAMKFQQFSAPVMAKGMEDTSFYRYNRLVSLNEVGGDPHRFGLSVPAFHHCNQDRQRHWPHAMLSTSTHDSKRSEDVRARIDVLSELATEWHKQVSRWSRLNQGKKVQLEAGPAPSRNDEYLLYQTLVGAWPAEALNQDGHATLRQRIDAYMLKAVREAKHHSSWLNPDEEYEGALLGFVHALLDDTRRNAFLAAFLPFQRKVSRFGLYNSLSQTLLKLTSPGVPDLYQGTELWDFSLVDPDNRRPVDYAHRRDLLSGLVEWADSGAGLDKRVRALLDSAEDGRPKLYLIWRALSLRLEQPLLFQNGDYLALDTGGTHPEHLCAFARCHRRETLVAVAPRWYATLCGGSEGPPLGREVWADTWIQAPPGERSPDYENVLTGERVTTQEGAAGPVFEAAALLSSFPVALLRSVGDRSV